MKEFLRGFWEGFTYLTPLGFKRRLNARRERSQAFQAAWARAVERHQTIAHEKQRREESLKRLTAKSGQRKASRRVINA